MDEPLDSSDEAPLLPSSAHHQTKYTFYTLRSPNSIIWLLTIINLFIQSTSYFIAIPSTRIYEDILCHHFYNIPSFKDEIDEKLCKGHVVQGELALIRGYATMGFAIPGFLLAYPYAFLADRIGRKTVYGLAVFGNVLSILWAMTVCYFPQFLPLRLVLLCPLLMIIGGSGSVTMTMIWATISDVASESARTNAFFRITSGGLLAEVVAPSVASLLMVKSPWIPFVIGAVSMILAGILFVFVPETLHSKDMKATQNDTQPFSSSTRDNSPLIRPPPQPESLDEPIEPLDNPGKSNNSSIFASFTKDLKLSSHRFYHERTIFYSWPILILLFTFLSHPLTIDAVDIIPQYVSKRFEWSLAETGYLVSLRALFNIFIFLVWLPWMSKALTSYNAVESIQHRDVLVARISCLFLVAGCALLAGNSIWMVIVGLFIYTLGTGFSAVCRSLITTLVVKDHVARLYAAISIVEKIGDFILAPGLAWLFKAGLKLGGVWLGLPFMGSAAFCALTAAAMWCVDLSSADGLWQ